MLRYLSIGSLLAGLLLAALGGLGACASSTVAGDDASSPRRVTVRDYRSRLTFTLRSGDDRERVDYYSERRDDASTKIQSPDILAGLLELFEKQGLGKHAGQGPAPATTNSATKCIEIHDARGTRHVMRQGDMGPEVARAFEDYVRAFLAIYQDTYALQNVDDSNPQGPSASDKSRN